jgi:hypothetical protein
MTPDRVQPMVARHARVRVECSELRESGPRPVHHRDRDGAVERHDRAGIDPREHVVEREDLRPVGLGARGRLIVHRGNRRLQLVLADRCGAEGAADQGDALADPSGVPELPALVGERHE